jgi:type IV secretion system protein VirB2
MTSHLFTDHARIPAKSKLTGMLVAFLIVAALAAPGLAMAQDFAGTDTKVCGFFSNINGLLNMASIVVVTIAIIFSGYQIAFAHKRISEVSPILIGGLLIGAAAQIAKMMIGTSANSCTATSGTAMVMNLLSLHYA